MLVWVGMRLTICVRDSTVEEMLLKKRRRLLKLLGILGVAVLVLYTAYKVDIGALDENFTDGKSTVDEAEIICWTKQSIEK